MNSIQQLTDINGRNVYKIWSKYSSSGQLGQLFCGRKKPTVISINDKKTKDYIDRKDWQPHIKTETIEEKEKKFKSNNKKLPWFLVRSNNNNNNNNNKT